jgi:hypothetical protein
VRAARTVVANLDRNRAPQGTERKGTMGLWNALTGKKTHCAGCGTVVPVNLENQFDEVYCSEACERNFKRLSSAPPPPAEEEISEVRDIPFAQPPLPR